MVLLTDIRPLAQLCSVRLMILCAALLNCATFLWKLSATLKTLAALGLSYFIAFVFQCGKLFTCLSFSLGLGLT